MVSHSTHWPSPPLPQPCRPPLEDSRGLQQLPLPEPLARSQHALCLKRKHVEVTGDLSANQRKCLPSQVCDPGKFSENSPAVKVWPLAAAGAKLSTQNKPGPVEPWPAPGPRRPLGYKGFENVLKLFQFVYFPTSNDIVHARSRPQLLLTIKVF